VLSWFTPVGPVYGQAHDDESDGDFGSGGVMLVPEDGASGMHLAVTAGKTSPVIVLDRDAMGGRGKFLASAPSGGCWCGPSFFIGSDGIGRVVLSTGASVQVYQIQTTPSVALINPVKAALVTGQDGGFFTSVSSRNLVAGTAVVWAVTRPVSPNPGTIQLVAISPATGATLLRTPAGTWPNNGANANLVPTVANGHVYVASYKNLSIFGLGTGGRAIAFQPPAAPEPAALLGHEVSGIIETISSGRMTLRLRDNRVVDVDDARAAAEGLTFPLSPGAAATVMGGYRGNTLVARAIQHAKPFALNWPADR
jgi:hypothetical protein